MSVSSAEGDVMNLVDTTAEKYSVHPVDIVQGAIDNLPEALRDIIDAGDLYNHIIQTNRVPHYVETYCVALEATDEKLL